MTNTMGFTDTALLELHFTATRSIRLPWYHGALWNALFRDLIRQFVDPVKSMFDLEFRIHPVETGCMAYEKGEPIHLGISFPFSRISQVTDLIMGFNDLTSDTGQLGPASLNLVSARCRVSSQTILPGSSAAHTRGNMYDTPWAAPLTAQMIRHQADRLARLEQFTLCLMAPLRLKSPLFWREKSGATYLDAGFFHAVPHALSHLLEATGMESESTMSLAPCPGLLREALYWQEITYGRKATTLGGLTGQISFTGTLSPAQALSLAAAQYVGLGKNRSFGFGFFTIPELSQDAPASLQPGLPLSRRIFSASSLSAALQDLPNSSPGPDGITVTDLKEAGTPFLERLSRRLMAGTHTQGGWKCYQQKKKDQRFRTITVFNATDRVIHRAVADFLVPVAESLLSDACFAYRPGRNPLMAVKKMAAAARRGYKTGVKADIQDFFGSVNIERLCDRLQGLFPFDDLSSRIREMLSFSGLSGLPQGSPLSPVLSNLYLDRFDQQMAAAGISMIRYGDDFTALALSDAYPTPESLLEKASDLLAPLDLKLNPEKSLPLTPETPFTFLGFSITGPRFTLEKSHKTSPKTDLWLPLFREEVINGFPVYLTTLCRGAYSNGPYIVIQDDQGRTRQVPWQTVSRIVAVGRAGFSSGVLYRAVKQGIPISFIDIMGRPTGHLTSTASDSPANESIQKKRFADPDFCLALARQIISAKIHNTHVLLRRNHVPVTTLKHLAQKALQADSMEQLRGFEGSAARIFFQTLGTLVEPFTFTRRVFYPSPDPVNAMLSFGYTLLYNRLATALQANGLDPYNGFFHRTGGRHLALASDMMEPLRHVIDRIVLTLIHRKEITPDDFAMTKQMSRSCVRLDGNGFRTFIRQYEFTMASQFQYSTAVKMSYNSFLDESARTLVHAIRLDTPLNTLRIR